MNKQEQLLQRVFDFFRQALACCFYPVGGWLSAWINRIFFPLLYLVGLYQWADFLNWSKISTQLADWNDITFPRLAVLQDAVVKWVLPLHIPLATGMKGATDRFLTIPDIILSPQILLLRILEPGLFILLNTLVLYTLGFWGLLLLRRKFGLSLAAFMAVFSLFNFNGHIIDHLSIGHFFWEGYFLLPFFAMLVFNLLDGVAGWKWICQTSLLLLAIFLQGSFHLFVLSLLFLVLLSLTRRRLLKPGLLAGLFTVLLSLFRIIPTALVAVDLKIGFLTGFLTLGDMFKGLVELVEPAHALDYRTLLNPLVAWWEFDHFIGWVGLFFVLGFGIFFSLAKSLQKPRYPELLIPFAILVFLSIGRLYKPVFLLGIPMLTGERVTSRFLILPLVFLFILGAMNFQRWLQTRQLGAGLQTLCLGLLLVLVDDLFQHMELWKVTHLDTIFPALAFNRELWVVANHPDPPYILALAVGMGISFLSLGFLIFKMRPSQKILSEN